jgi:S1-C subfamily serine protease
MRHFTTEGGVHATFRGDLQVDFATRAGQTPVFGVLEAAVIDFIPKLATPDVLAERLQAAKTFREALGIDIKVSQNLVVTTLAPTQAGTRSGLKVGDRLQSLDGVRLLEETDFLATSAGRSAALDITRGPLATRHRL